VAIYLQSVPSGSTTNARSAVHSPHTPLVRARTFHCQPSRWASSIQAKSRCVKSGRTEVGAVDREGHPRPPDAEVVEVRAGRTDETRYNLNGVYFEPSGGGIERHRTTVEVAPSRFMTSSREP